MALKSDNRGFLVSESSVDVNNFTRSIESVRTDTSAILAMLQRSSSRTSIAKRARTAAQVTAPTFKSQAGITSTPRTQATSAAAERSGTATRSRVRDSGGRFLPASAGAEPAQRMQRAVESMTRQQGQQLAADKREAHSRKNQGLDPAAAVNAERDGRGRFMGGKGGDGGADKGRLARMFDGIKGLAAPSHGNGQLDKIDPAIEAANEMKNLVSGPLKGVGKVAGSVIGRMKSSGRDDAAVPWYRRMLAQLKLSRKESADSSRAEIRAIEKGGHGGGDGGGLIQTILSTLFGPVGIALAAGAAAAWLALSDQGKKAWESMTSWFKDSFAPVIKIWQDVAGWFAKKFPEFGVQKAPQSTATPTPQNTDPAGYRTDKGLQQRRDMLQKQYDDAKNDPSKAAYAKSKKAELDALDREMNASQLGTRGRAVFDAVSGGTDLAKYGTYTPAEADRIRALKGSGANTSANLPGGMPTDVQQKIVAQAKAAGLDPSTMLKIAAMESGGNASAISRTGAIGIYQFTGKTATGVGIKDRFDADQNIAGGMALTKQNTDMLRKAGLPVSAANLYMMLQLGPVAAKEVIAGAGSGKNISDLSPATQKGIALNYGAGSKTAADYLAKNTAALDARGNSVIGKSVNLPTVTAAGSPAIGALPATAPASANQSASGLNLPTAAVPVPAPPAPAPVVNIPVPLNSAPPMQVIVTNQSKVSSDLAVRRLTQIATGGIAN